MAQVIEVLEGLRREVPECLRVRGKALKDGKVGYVTLHSDVLEPMKVLVCRLRTVLTSAMDVSASKTLRKVEEGEVFEQLEEAKEDEKRKLQRVRVRRRADVQSHKSQLYVCLLVFIPTTTV